MCLGMRTKWYQGLVSLELITGVINCDYYCKMKFDRACYLLNHTI